MKLKENQKVYIRGGKDAIQGKRVIEELERRGGINTDKLSGDFDNCLYFIQPDGKINFAYDLIGAWFVQFIKEFYTEVKVEVKEWPENGDCFYFVGPDMRWCMSVNDGCPTCKDIIMSGNCFRTREEAVEVSREFHKIIDLKKIKEYRDGKEKV